VTEGGVLKTPRASHDLTKISSVSLHRRPFLLALPLAGAVTAFVLGWWRYFSTQEVIWLLGLSAAAVGITSQIGVLRVDSIAITEPELATSFGWWPRLKAVRAAVEQAIDKSAARERQP
jgi:hypothetical protein